MKPPEEGYGAAVMVTTGRGTGGKQHATVYDSEGQDPGPLTPAAQEKEAARREDAAARRAEARVKRDYEKTQNLASPNSLYEDYPAHMEPYLRDQSAHMRDDFLRFNAQAQQRMSRAFGRVNGSLRYTGNIAMGAMGLVGEASVAAQPPLRGGFESVRALARVRKDGSSRRTNEAGEVG
jgi:hypothetical protein